MRIDSTDGTGRGQNRLCIAVYESMISPVRRDDLNALVCEPDDYQEAEEDPKPAEEEREGSEIAKVKFEDLKKRMPVRAPACTLVVFQPQGADFARS